MGMHKRLANKQLSDLTSMSDAWMSLLCATLTESQLAILDRGETDPAIEAATRAASRYFLMTIHWALVRLTEPAAESDSAAKVNFAMLRRVNDMTEELDALKKRLSESDNSPALVRSVH